MDRSRNLVEKMTWVWVGGMVGVILLIVVGVLIADARAHKPNPKHVVLPATQSTGKSRLILNDAVLPPLAPLTWNVAEGAYMIELLLGDARVLCVLDTGSSQVSAKVRGCQWTQCDAQQCTTQDCPCDDGKCHYTPSANSYTLAAGHAYDSVMKYGSQEDTVTHMVDTLVIPKVSLTCAQLFQPAAHASMHMQRAQHGVRADMVVHQVHAIQGTSTSNMFGLARPSADGATAPAVLDKLFQATAQPKVWSVMLQGKTGWWALGSLPCFVNKQSMPLLDPPLFRSFVSKFYVVRLLGMRAGPSLGTLATVSAAPKYAVLDTGTTYTYGHELLGASLGKLGYDEQTWYVQLLLGDRRKPVTLTFSPEDMQDPEVPHASILQATPGRTLATFHDLFQGNNVLLVGAYMMRNKYWEFDLGANTVSVEPLR